MTTHYVDSNAAGAGTGADWANAFTTLNAAFTAGAAGDTYYVAHDHAQTQASALTLTPKGTTAAPDFIVCVSSAGSVPPVAADLRDTATITVTGAFDLVLGGQTLGLAYWYGINLHVGAGSSGQFRTGGSFTTHYMEECSFNHAGTSGALIIGSADPRLYLKNHDFGFAVVGSAISCAGGLMVVDGGTLIGAAVPATLFANNASGSKWEFNGFDFSPKTSGALTAGFTIAASLVLNNCKLGGAVTFGTPTAYFTLVDLNNVDSGDTNYRGERHGYAGVQTTQTTTLIRTGGASDGTTPISWKVVTTANCTNFKKFACKPIMSEFNTAVGGALTATVEFLHDSVTDLTDAEIWGEIQYLGTSGFPLSLFADDGLVNLLSTPTDQAASTATWDTTGMANPNTQKISIAFTPQEAGIAVVNIYIGKASATIYVDPLVTIA